MHLADPLEPADHARGAEPPAIVLVEYGDFECARCARASPIIDALLGTIPRLRFAFRHFPVALNHRHAVYAAEAAESAAVEGRFWPMYEALFARHRSLARGAILAAAGEIGLDAARVAHELDFRLHHDRVRRDIDSGHRSGATWTPTFYLNGRRLPFLDDPAVLYELVGRTMEETAHPGALQ